MVFKGTDRGSRLPIVKPLISVTRLLGFPGGSEGKESAGNAGDLGEIPGKIPWRKEWLSIPVFLHYALYGI